MLLLLPLLAALASTPDTPPAAPATRLEEIGRVRALPACTPIIVRANSAITSALENDSTLGILVFRLKNMSYDGQTDIAQRHLRADLASFAKKIHDGAVAGEDDVKKLRAMAAEAPNPERKVELKKFADALGGALFRQERTAFDLNRALVVQEGRSSAFSGRMQDMGLHNISHDITSIPDPSGASSLGYQPSVHFDTTLRAIADDFSERIELITSDEGIAADHSQAATTGC